MTPEQAALADRVRAELPRALDDLRRLVAIPSVSALPEHADDVEESAALVRELLRAEGVDARVVRAGGSRPAVLGHRPGPPGAPAVLLYAHHDVQPVGSAPWSSDPFTLTERDGRLYGRGASDDKAAVALHLAALRAFGDQLPVAVTVFVEGEEELGSPALPALLEVFADELRADVVVVPDAVNPDPGTPSTTTALRGNADLTVTLTGLPAPVHSGLYGGVAPCALTSLVRLLATMYDDDGDVRIEGVTRDLDEAPTVLLDLPGAAPDPHAVGRAVVLSPAVTVLALDAVPVDAASNVLHATARAKIGVRTPPRQDPATVLQQVETHLQARVPAGCRLSVERGRAGRGFRAAPPSRAWLSAAEAAYRRAPVEVGAGGSIPFLALLQQHLPDAAFLVTAVQDSASRAHSCDESLDLAGFERAAVAHCLLLHELGRSPLVG